MDKGRNIKVKGARGEISRRFMEDFINIVQEGDKIKITVIATGFQSRRGMRSNIPRPQVPKGENPQSLDITKPAYLNWNIQKLK